jgi:hypothetical protein
MEVSVCATECSDRDAAGSQLLGWRLLSRLTCLYTDRVCTCMACCNYGCFGIGFRGSLSRLNIVPVAVCDSTLIYL